MTEAQAAPETSGADGELSFLDLALVLAENLRTLILVPIAAGLVALGISFLITPTYTATTRVLPPQQQQSAAANLLANQFGGIAGFVGAAAGIKNPADTYVAMIKSRTVADKMLARFKLRELYDERYDDDARDELAKRTRVTAGKDGLIVIEVDDHDARRAASMANAYVEELHGLTQRLAVTEAAQRRLFFENQLKQTKNDLTKAEIALRGSGISEATLKTVPQSAIEALARLKAQVTAQEVKLGAMRGYMTESNPEFKQAQQELAAVRAQLAKAEQIDPVKATSIGAEYVAKFRDFKYHETLFDLMAKQYEMARLDEAREGAVIQVVDAAIPPERKSSPKRVLTGILAAITGLFVMIFVAFMRHMLQSAANESGSAEKLKRLQRLLRLRRA
ncbi:MAG: lipopolysaccharide biosynthesis protein [Betaproteobacteria bacterium]|nr:MAG: lipopolysaccharide biosynthesis protein [Betaproteobacteria bacterium]